MIYTKKKYPHNTLPLFSGEEFILTFLFNENGIIVYSGDDGGCFQYKFVPVFDISEIKVIQLWDDIEYIKEIVFRYKHD